MSPITIHLAGANDLVDLISLMRIYCDTSDEPHVPKPATDDLVKLCHEILQNTQHHGLFFLARDQRNRAIGFASLFWSWSLKNPSGRQAILSDLFVHPDARGQGVAGLLIDRCREQAMQRGDIRSMVWQTAVENRSAQHVYRRFGLEPERCADYEFSLKEHH